MSVKLYYFDGLGRGEVIRWILYYGGVNFEDIRFPSLTEEVKKRARWGQVPLLEVDGKALTQSVAISRYLAEKYKLVPENPFEAALCNEYVDAVQDILNPMYRLSFLPAGEDKDDQIKKQIETNKTKFFDVFDSIIKSNGGAHLVGDKLTWADLWLAFSIDQFQLILGSNIAEGRENVNKLKEGVMKTPQIKAWLEKRPKTKF